MKLQRSIVFCALFLGAAILSAAPAPVAEPAAAAEPVLAAAKTAEAPPVSGSLGASRCEVGSFPEPPEEFPSFCGGCSQNPCKGAWVDSSCGTIGGEPAFCRNQMGLLCAVDGGVRCFCSTSPNPPWIYP